MKGPKGSHVFEKQAAVLLCVVMVELVVPSTVVGQTDDPMRESHEAHYFDFWPGTWIEVVDGQPDPSATTFTVRESVHPAAFEEQWKLVYEGAAHHSIALRAWDQVNERWMFAWVSDNGLFQVWEGKKFGDDWYIVREFEIDGQQFLSRQAWVPRGEEELIRIMERSFDGGQTWESRSRTRFRRTRAELDTMLESSRANRAAP